MRFKLFGRVYTLRKKVYGGMICIALALVAVLGCILRSLSAQETLVPVPTVSNPSTPDHKTPTLAATAPLPEFYAVHISGEVHVPGVYWMPKGSIVGDVVTNAGGLKQTANTAVVNLALRVEDGMHIHIPDCTADNTQWLPDSGVSSATSQPTKINLNTATLTDLMTLSGVGESTAQDILQYRTEKGPFKTIDDLMQVPGIKQAKFDKIKDKITV